MREAKKMGQKYPRHPALSYGEPLQCGELEAAKKLSTRKQPTNSETWRAIATTTGTATELPIYFANMVGLRWA